MKLTNLSRSSRRGFALLMVLIMVGVSVALLAGAMYRSHTVALLNQRNNDYNVASVAAEAAVEKVFALMAWQFQSYGVASVSNSLASLRTNIPTGAEYSYWTNYTFSDAQGNNNQTYVSWVNNYSGYLPAAYGGTNGGLFTTNAPVYRIVSNVRLANSGYNVVGTAQEDVLLALVPLTTWAIFYNGMLEFTGCAAMVVNGRVHANGEIDVGTGASLQFNGGVSTTATLGSPGRAGNTWGPYTTNNWNTGFASSPGYVTNVASVTVSLNMTNSHFLIDMPTNGESPTSTIGQQRLYNQAQMILLVTNKPGDLNPTVVLTMQSSVGGAVPGSDPSKSIWTVTNASAASLATNMPFLDLDNVFYDRREQKTNIVTEIDVGRFDTWSATNSRVQGKLPAASGLYPTILYVADLRTNSPKQLPVVRVTNGQKLPANNNYGFSIATKNPIYTVGNYNVQTSAGTATGTTNTTYTVPAALMADSITILSSNWSDANSYNTFTTGGSYAAQETSINAAILVGAMPTTANTVTNFSGGVHNLTRFLQDWNSQNLWLNTSILRLWDSNMATNQYRIVPGTGAVDPYYRPPNRKFSFDVNFLNPAKVPPGIPVALVPIRFSWGSPPPGVVTYTPDHN